MDPDMLNRYCTKLVLFTIALSAGSATGGEGWYGSYEEAKAAADEMNRPLLLHFYAPWCGPCQKMKRQVFSQSEVQSQLRQGVAAAEIDITKRKDLVQQFAVSTIPRDIVVYPGKPAQTLGVGFQSRTAYLSLLSQVSATGAASSKPKQEEESVVVRNDIPAPTPIGLEGFCPVRLIQDREWITGDKDITATWRGLTYYFSSLKAKETFEKDTRKYSPQNLGCDPVVLYDDQRAITGKIKYGAFFDDRLYLFESFENRSEFKKNPLKYSRIRHAVKVQDLAGQRYH